MLIKTLFSSLVITFTPIVALVAALAAAPALAQSRSGIEITFVRDLSGIGYPDGIRIQFAFTIMRNKVGKCRRSRLEPRAATIEL